MALTGDPQLEIADNVVLMPDLLGYMLCGEVSTEYTNATTTQMLDCKTGNWSKRILDMLGVSESLLTHIQKSGEPKGQLLQPLIQRWQHAIEDTTILLRYRPESTSDYW